LTSFNYLFSILLGGVHLFNSKELLVTETELAAIAIPASEIGRAHV
jgi:hypothetical protein